MDQVVTSDLVKQQADLLVDEFPQEPLEKLAADLESEQTLVEGVVMALAIALELQSPGRVPSEEVA